MTLLGLPTTKHFFSFILGCPQDFNFAWPFWYGWIETGLNRQNSQAKLKSCRHPRIKLKTWFVVGRPTSFIENCSKKVNSYNGSFLCMLHFEKVIKFGKKLRKALLNLPYIHFLADSRYPKIQFWVPDPSLVCMSVCSCTFFLILGLTKLLCHVKIDLGGGKNEFQLFVKIIGITIDCEASWTWR